MRKYFTKNIADEKYCRYLFTIDQTLDMSNEGYTVIFISEIIGTKCEISARIYFPTTY